MAFNIADMFEHTADAVPSRTALIVGDERRTYSELEERANCLAHHLASVGVGQGDHVGVYAYNSVEWVEAMLATYKLRAVPINVNYRYVEEELRYLFDDADLVAVVAMREFCELISAVASDVEKLRHVVVIEDGSGKDCSSLDSVALDDALAAQSAVRDFPERSDDDLYVLYTGGTTGMPKGVMWRHEDVFRTLGGGMNYATGEPVPEPTTLAERAAASEPTISMPIAPLMHGAAQWGMTGALLAGNTVVLVPRFDAHEVWKAIERNGVHSISITGDAMARPLIEAFVEAGSYDVSSLKDVGSSAAIFSKSVKEQFLDLLPGVAIRDAVGASETGFNGAMPVTKEGLHSEGGPRIYLGYDSLIVDDDMQPMEAAPGAVGRLARTGNVPIGYYKDPEKTAKTFVEVDGKRYSVPGDYVRVEEDGTCTLLGRGSGTINSGGEKIYPEEVESALKAHPEVYDALVVGVPDERWGQRVAAVVQPRQGATPTLEELDAHCRTRIAGYKVPRELHFVDEVARSPSGKPDYTWAKDIASKERTA